MHTRRAFTLIELLVVIAVVALLIGILLPSLSGAREAGRAVVCMANVRSVVLAGAVYETDNRGFLVGPNTSGSDLQQNRPYTPGRSTPCQDWDFVSPLLGDSLNLPTNQLDKFEQICMTKFKCPNNSLRYGMRFAGNALPIESTGQFPLTLSYMTPAYFQMYANGITNVGGRSVEAVPASEPVTIPKGYIPRSDKVGILPSKKIMIFEGARYWNASINGFDYSTGTNGTGLDATPQGNFLSRGSAFSGSGENYLRDAISGYQASKLLRQISLRHSKRMNAGMFDGHVEAMDNERSADPTYYAPSGTILKTPTQTWYYYVGPSTWGLRTPNSVMP